VIACLVGADEPEIGVGIGTIRTVERVLTARTCYDPDVEVVIQSGDVDTFASSTVAP
jgi:hypothetical protein